MSFKEYFYMDALSDNFSIQWRSMQQHQIRSIGLVSVETAKSQRNFFTLNDRRPSNDNDVKFFNIQTAIAQKLQIRMNIVVWTLKNN